MTERVSSRARRFYYQLEDTAGIAMTDTDITAEEHLIYPRGDSAGNRVQTMKVDITNGMIQDTLRIKDPIKPGTNEIVTRLQSFTVGYRGKSFDLPTVFEHRYVIENGHVTSIDVIDRTP